MKSLRQSSTGVLSLNTINGTATSTIDKADAHNNQFQSVFTKGDCSNLPTLNSSPTKSLLPIQVSTQGIVKLLKELRLHKAPGPDYYNNNLKAQNRLRHFYNRSSRSL